MNLVMAVRAADSHTPLVVYQYETYSRNTG